jgi:lysophospholipase L1-like esterase
MIPLRPSTDDERRHFVRYTRTQQWPLLARYPVQDALHTDLLAHMLACPPEAIRSLVGSLRDTMLATATDMMADPSYRAAIGRLPFRDGDRIVAVGDSITADRIGWFELLSASIGLVDFPDVFMHNLGVSGNTTADALERFDLIEAAQPTRVLILLGTNDARSHGRARSYRMVSSSETQRNLAALVDLITQGLNAPVTLITPPAVDQLRISTSFEHAPIHWHDGAIDEIADVVRKVDSDCIDLHAATAAYDRRELLELDGVHPSLPGQRFILARIIEHLVTEAAA